MADYYRPKQMFRTEITVLKSRFIAAAHQVTSVDDAKYILAATREEMSTANHHVYAYIIGFGSSVIEGLSDDGEPSGTAGQPVMAVLRGSNLGDVLVIVTRYFGGTLLGTGGLVRAYTDAAKAALEGLEIERKVERNQLLTIIPYSTYERAIRLIRQHETLLLEEEFGTDVSLLLDVPIDHLESLERSINDLCAGKAEFLRY